MRFSNANYLKAFPRENKKPIKVEVIGNVIEEAEKVQPKKPDPAPATSEPGNVIEDAEIQEGVEDGGTGSAE